MPSLDISGRGLRLDSASDAADIVAQLNALPVDLDCVSLSGNTFGVEACRAIAAALSKKKSIKACLFSDIFTGRLRSEIPDCLGALVGALCGIEIESLDLSDNAFGPAGAYPLHPFLSTTRSLRTLQLNNNGLGVEGGRAIAKALIDQASRNTRELLPSTLVSFSAGRNRLEDGSMALLAQAFAVHPTLESLRIPQNGIRADGIATILTGLKACRGLDTLDLQDNTLTRAGAISFASAVPSWLNLRTLNLSDCLLGPHGGLLIIRSLIQHKVTSLVSLHLAYNEINQIGAAELAEWLDIHAAGLTLLELNGNTFDPLGIEVSRIRATLERFGHPKALDELDEMDDGASESDYSDSTLSKEDDSDSDAETTSQLEASLQALKLS